MPWKVEFRYRFSGLFSHLREAENSRHPQALLLPRRARARHVHPKGKCPAAVGTSPNVTRAETCGLVGFSELAVAKARLTKAAPAAGAGGPRVASGSDDCSVALLSTADLRCEPRPSAHTDFGRAVGLSAMVMMTPVSVCT
mgnify:CR=1 FL=1